MHFVLSTLVARERKCNARTHSSGHTVTGVLNVDIVEVLTKNPNKNNQPDNKFKGIQPPETR